MKKNILVISILVVFSTIRGYGQEKTIRPDNARIRYMGRMQVPTDSSAVLCWTAANAAFNFDGSGVKAVMNDQDGKNYYDIIVDGKIMKVLHPLKGKHEYILAEGLKEGKHSFELFKRTEASMGKTIINNFKLGGSGRLLKSPSVLKRKIEFYGNSITCGYAIIDTATKGSNSAPQFEDAYSTYASLTARHFNADYRCITKSGIGITVSWFPLIMPEVYDRLYYDEVEPKWDFSKYTPDIVVVNLFQNDFWIVKQPGNQQFKNRFGSKPPTQDFIINAYASFIKKIASLYPDANIICALGNMDASKEGSPWISYVKTAAASLKNKHIYTCIFPYKGTDGHPNIEEQRQMADVLTNFIEKNFKW